MTTWAEYDREHERLHAFLLDIRTALCACGHRLERHDSPRGFCYFCDGCAAFKQPRRSK